MAPRLIKTRLMAPRLIKTMLMAPRRLYLSPDSTTDVHQAAPSLLDRTLLLVNKENQTELESSLILSFLVFTFVSYKDLEYFASLSTLCNKNQNSVPVVSYKDIHTNTRITQTKKTLHSILCVISSPRV